MKIQYASLSIRPSCCRDPSTSLNACRCCLRDEGKTTMSSRHRGKDWHYWSPKIHAMSIASVYGMCWGHCRVQRECHSRAKMGAECGSGPVHGLYRVRDRLKCHCGHTRDYFSNNRRHTDHSDIIHVSDQSTGTFTIGMWNVTTWVDITLWCWWRSSISIMTGITLHLGTNLLLTAVCCGCSLEQF